MHKQLAQDQLYVTTDILILTVRSGQLDLLLSRRTAPPYQRCWALPGRFIGLDESAETSAKRLLAEMLPGQNGALEQLYTFTDVNRDPRGRVISAAYLLVVPWEEIKEQVMGNQVSFRCFRIGLDEEGLKLTGDDGKNLEPGELAFDHGKIIETGIRRLRGKIDYSDIGFRFLKNRNAFTLSELQTVFEAVLGETLDSSNFRRAILGRYEKKGQLIRTDQSEQQCKGRPAALYRFIF